MDHHRLLRRLGVEDTHGYFFPLLSVALCHVGENILLSYRVFVRRRVADFLNTVGKRVVT